LKRASRTAKPGWLFLRAVRTAILACISHTEGTREDSLSVAELVRVPINPYCQRNSHEFRYMP
jgi:hypothetical protein